VGVSVNGLGSGLDITSIVSSLMNVEALPQQQLKQAQSQSESVMSVLRGLNTKAAALGTLAAKVAAPNAFNLLTATSSSTGITATAGTAAAAGSFDLTVTRLARSVVLQPEVADLPLRLAGGAQRASSAVSFAPASCDAHVLAETKQPYLFVLGVTVDGGDEVPLDLPLSADLQDALAAMVQRVCR